MPPANEKEKDELYTACDLVNAATHDRGFLAEITLQWVGKIQSEEGSLLFVHTLPLVRGC